MLSTARVLAVEPLNVDPVLHVNPVPALNEYVVVPLAPPLTAAQLMTPEMLDCILKGIDEETDGYAKDVQGAANLGYCELFDFKCAGNRTCSAWLSGGPITKKMSKSQSNMLMMAKTEYNMEDGEE